MTLTPSQAQLLDELATRALDALRDQDRAALALASDPEPTPMGREHARRMAVRAQEAEQQLHDAIHALVDVDQLQQPRRRRPEAAALRPLRAFLGD